MTYSYFQVLIAVIAVGTGHLIPENACFIDTVFDGAFVWHVYEVV